MLNLLKASISQIDNLDDYYSCQYDYVVKRAIKSKQKYKYGLTLDKFFYNQTNPETSFPLTSEEEDIISEMLEDYSIDRSENNDSTQVKYKLKDTFVKEGLEIDPVRAREAVICLFQQSEVLSESMLVMLMIKYEDSISSIFRYIIEKYPQSFLSQKSISYSDLLSMKSDIEEIKNKFVEDEVEAIMRGPISDWYSCLETKHKIKFLFSDGLFDAFKEVYYRRNLVVHNQGIVNDIYLRFVKNSKAQKGDKLSVNREYMDHAFSLARLMLIDTIFALRGLTEEKDDLVDWIINSFGFNCLVEKEWEMAKYTYKVVLQDKSIASLDMLIATINYLIAIKNIDGVEAIRDEANALDVSALKLPFATAKAALLNDHKEVSMLLDECLEKKEIRPRSIKSWPLYNEFRESEEYQEFLIKHKEDFNLGEYTAPTDDEASILMDAEQEQDRDDDQGGKD